MAMDLVDYISDANIGELLEVLFANDYYQILFPFLLIYSVLFTVLQTVKIFKTKDGKPIKSVIFLISIVVAFFGVSFETAPGYTVGDYLMMLFPNISAITIGFLGLYVMGGLLGKDFFRGVFRKDISAYLFFAGGAIGLGAVIYYGGIVMGFWDNYPITSQNYWNMILGIGLLIMGMVFLFVDLVGIGLVMLTIFGIYVANYGDDVFILEYFIDPIVFIALIVIGLISWMNSDPEKRALLKKRIRDGKKSKKNFIKQYGREPEAHEAVIYDIMSQGLESNKKALERLKK